jgi:hypothetical protein
VHENSFLSYVSRHPTIFRAAITDNYCQDAMISCFRVLFRNIRQIVSCLTPYISANRACVILHIFASRLIPAI